MEPTVFDHLLAFALAGAMPAYAVWGFRRMESDLRAGRRGARLRGYREIVAVEWGLVGLIAVLWIATGRSAGALGLAFRTSGLWWVGAVLAAAACGFFVIQLLAVRRDPQKLAPLRRQLEPIRPMMPEDDREFRWFQAVSVTAGICEEVIYRGFLLGHVVVLAGTVAAVLVSSVVFGLGHAYQGRAGILKITIVGLAMAGLYLQTGSLWAPIVLHIVMDITNGMIARMALVPGRSSGEHVVRPAGRG